MFGYVTILEPELKVKDFRRYIIFLLRALSGIKRTGTDIWDS